MGHEITGMGIKAGFLVFSAAAAWQDLRQHNVNAGLFTAAGIGSVLLRLWQMIIYLMENGNGGALKSISAMGFDVALGMAVGGFLLLLSLITKEAVGAGDGCFFLVSGIYLGFSKNLLLLGGGLLLCLPVSLSLFLVGMRKGVNVRNICFPFLPFVFPVGIGVIML